MRRENRNAPEILGRLRTESDHQAEDRTPPRWARPLGWLIVAALIGTIIYVMIDANPL